MKQGIWQIFTWTLTTLMGSVCPKQKMHELKIYRVMCNDTEEWWKIWKGIDLSVQNWHNEVDEHWPKDSKILKMWTAMGCFWPKYIMLRLKKYVGVMLDGIMMARLMHNLKENWFVLLKMAWKI